MQPGASNAELTGLVPGDESMLPGGDSAQPRHWFHELGICLIWSSGTRGSRSQVANVSLGATIWS